MSEALPQEIKIDAGIVEDGGKLKTLNVQEDVKVEQKIVGKKERCFAGLGNQGATCYMNSLLQALYMSPDFRKMIYSWKHDPEKNASKKDCILYQLQKLFATLQIIQSRAEEDEKSVVRYADTTELTGSFQWDYRDAMQQHDVQEFFMQLFDAVEQSFEQNGIYGVIGDLYQGITTDFVRCKTCNYESTRDAKFFDLQLPVKNEFENISNSSIEEALKNFLNVETLTDSNKYECPTCNQKQEALKGSKFVKLPKILTLQLIRFTLDMQTFDRKKLNDSVSFPLLLNMNHFLDEDKCQDKELLQNLINSNPLNEVKKQMKKPETNLYKQQKDIKKKKDEEQLNDMQQNFNKQLDDELRDTVMVDETTETPQAKGARERMEKRMKEREEHQKRLKEMKSKGKKTEVKARPKFDRSKLNNAFMSNAKSAKDDTQGWALDFSNETQNVAVKQGVSEEEQVNQAIAASMQEQPQNPETEDPVKNKIPGNNALPTSKEAKPIVENKPEPPKQIENKKSQAEMEKQIGIKLKEIEAQFLNDGQFVYELYGIMLQSGGAHGGHYSAYIKDFEEGDWYHFNDSFVKKISVTDLVDAFGRNETPKTRRLPQSANAYMLMYKLLDKPEDKISSIPIHEIPDELVEDVQSTNQQQQRQTISEIERKQKMQLKVVHAKMTGEEDFQEIGQAKVILVDRKVDTYKTVKELIMKEYEIEEKDEALFRVRMYNVQFKILMDTYEGREDLTLEQLKIYPMKTLAFEQRESVDTPWKQYDPNLMQVRVILWEKDMAEKYFSLQAYSEEKSQRIKVPKDMKMAELKALLQDKFKLQSCVLMKRTPMMQNQAVELFGENTDSQGLNELRINEGLNLYVEDGKVEFQSSSEEKPELSKNGLSKWEIEFELEVNRYQIKFNLIDNPNYDQFVIIDRRQIVEQLKQVIAKKIGEDLDNLIFRRGGNHGAELIDDDLSFKQANIYNMMSIYIEKGQPTRKGWKKLRFFVSQLYNPDWTLQIQSSEENEVLREPHDHEFFTHQELSKIPVKTLCKVKDVKQQICDKFADFYPQHTWLKDPKQFRLREKLSDKLTQAYHDDKILNTYSMHDDKEIAIQQISSQDEQGDISEKQLIMIKFWNQESWELDLPIEIWVDKNATLKSFAEAISNIMPNLEGQNISATKINSPWNFHRVQLPFVEWVPLMKEDICSNQLMQNPFYVSTDGILFIVKDDSKVSRPMTQDEREMYRCEEFEGNNMFNGSGGKDGKRRGPQEQGVKITVMSKQQEQPEEELKIV